MTILKEILDWSQGLPAWQSDALARLFAAGTLTSDDFYDLFALLKAEHGIPNPKGRKANRLSADHIPVGPASETHVRILALKNLRHVNAIAENQCLSFSPTGLTLIYGDNGSGKSGYARVLKCACRARDQREPIHPNAYLPVGQASKAEATFEIEVNGKPGEVSWVYGQPAPEILSTLAVFDSHCARSYLDEEGDFAYVPYGLDILKGLADACNKLKRMVDNELALSRVDTSAFNELVGDTAVGQLIRGLSHETSRKQVEKLATLTPEEMARRVELEQSLKEGNPAEKASRLRLCASRIAKIAERTPQKLAMVDDSAVTRLQDLINKYHAAQAAADLAARQFKEDPSLLPGTGGEAWKNLFQAAQRFAAEAYPGMQLPDLSPEAQCPLCQQPLAEGAERLRRFHEFITQEVEKVAQTCKHSLDEAHNALTAQEVSLGMDEELFQEIEALDKILAWDTHGFVTALLARHTAIQAGIRSRKIDKLADLPPSPVSRIQALVDKLNQEAETLERLTDEQERAAFQNQLNDLDARVQLAKVKGAVLTAIEHLDHQERLNKCLSAVRTNAISLKTTELSEKVVSKELGEALNDEFKRLGVGNLQVTLASRSERGKTIHKLKLDLPQVRTPSDILSEGEQRAIALCSFIVEVKMGGGSGGMIFDDPVSSLDHKSRERLARRLTQEGSRRQVIIFTHDIYFLNLLLEETQKSGMPYVKLSLIHRSEGFGVADPNLPFEGMRTKDRVGYLRNKQQQIDKVYRSGDEPEYRRLTFEAYRELRIAWERAIEEVLLSSVVLRFRESIETQRLAAVAVEDNDYAIIYECMSRCSNYAHDQALLGGLEVPEPDELLQDINLLDNWRKQIEERGKDLKKRRKSS